MAFGRTGWLWAAAAAAALLALALAAPACEEVVGGGSSTAADGVPTDGGCQAPDDFDEELKNQQESQRLYEQRLAEALASRGSDRDSTETVAACAAAAVVAALLAVLAAAGRRD